MNNYFIVKDTEGVQGHWGFRKKKKDAQGLADSYAFDSAVVASNLNPELVQFEKIANNWQDSERTPSTDERDRKVKWVKLRRNLKASQFYQLALDYGNANLFTVIMTVLAKEDYRWVDDLQFSMSTMAQQLFTANHLNQNQIDDLNIILTNSSVPFQITVS